MNAKVFAILFGKLRQNNFCFWIYHFTILQPTSPKKATFWYL